MVSPLIKVNLFNREGSTFIYKTHYRHQIIYYKPYDERLKLLNLYSVQRRRERYQIIYLWKIIEELVPNLSTPITCTYSERRGRYCVVSYVNMGRLGTLSYNSFRWRSISMFNKLPKYVRIVSSCSVDKTKSQLDKHLRNIVDLPCQSGFNNSLDGGDCLHGGHYEEGLAANSMLLNNHK